MTSHMDGARGTEMFDRGAAGEPLKDNGKPYCAKYTE